MHNFSIVKQSFSMSIQNIKSNKMRSFLTTLGIIIGVTAVIALITIVQGVTTYIMSQFSDLGAGKLIVYAQGTVMKEGLTDLDISELSELEYVSGVSPTISITTTAVSGDVEFDKITLEGKNEVYFNNNSKIVKYGRGLNISDMSGQTNVCVVNEKCVKKLFPGINPIGQQIKIAGYQYTVVGISGTDNNIMGNMSDTSNSDGTIIVPYKNALTISGSANATQFEVMIEDTSHTTEVITNLKNKLNGFFNDNKDAYSVVSSDSLLKMVNDQMGMMQTMLAGIASIALVVGGIGIMNMMLVSVTERTKEIGLRKALGAEPFRIQLQFLLESVVLSLVGGVIGVTLGLLISYIAALALKTDFSISWFAIILGVGFSAGIGIIFGWVPAKRASELNPIDALRSE